MKRLFAPALIGAALLMAGCGEGIRLDRKEAGEWVTDNHESLLELSAMLEECDGEPTDEFNRIIADGTAFTAHCSDYQVAIVKRLDRLGIPAVAYFPTSEAVTSGWTEFLLYSQGIVTSGESISVTHYSEPTDCKNEETREEGYAFSRGPLFDGRCDWIFTSEEH